MSAQRTGIKISRWRETRTVDHKKNEVLLQNFLYILRMDELFEWIWTRDKNRNKNKKEKKKGRTEKFTFDATRLVTIGQKTIVEVVTAEKTSGKCFLPENCNISSVLSIHIINLLLLNNFYPAISYRRDQKESDELLYTIWSLVMVRNQLVRRKWLTSSAVKDVDSRWPWHDASLSNSRPWSSLKSVLLLLRPGYIYSTRSHFNSLSRRAPKDGLPMHLLSFHSTFLTENTNRSISTF